MQSVLPLARSDGLPDDFCRRILSCGHSEPCGCVVEACCVGCPLASCVDDWPWGQQRRARIRVLRLQGWNQEDAAGILRIPYEVVNDAWGEVVAEKP